MHAVAVLALISICVQLLPLATAQEFLAGSGMVLPAADMQTLSGSGEALNPSEMTGAVLPVDEEGEVVPGPPVPPEPIVSPLGVRINEVMWAGSDLSTADEWLELTAVPLLTGAVLTDPLSLEGWTVSQSKEGTETVMAVFDASHIIHSGGYLVIANYGKDDSRLWSQPALVASSVSLPNTKLLLRLRDSAGNLIDEVDDGIGAPFAGANPSGEIKASMERIDPLLPGTLHSNWRTAATSRGYDMDSPLLGTPGFNNGSIELPDTLPPEDAQQLRAFALSGAVIALWTPSVSDDVARQQIVLITAAGETLASLDLPPTSTGVILEGDWQEDLSITHSLIDHSGYESPGVSIYVQPLHKPIINELLPDPVDSDAGEWIELANPFLEALDLSGWVLRSGSRHYVFPVGTGSFILPGEVLLLSVAETGLTLPNAGGSVDLSVLGRVIDHLDYSSLPEGVSQGRVNDLPAPVCTPTPGAFQSASLPTVIMDGFVSQGTDPLTLNLAAVASGGTLAGARCQWDFGDGYTSDSCNPPAHKMKAQGDVSIRLEVLDYCGNTMIHTRSVFVLQQANKEKKVSPTAAPCSAVTSTGIVLTEFLPAPKDGSDEWIELRRTGGPSVSLCGWFIDDREGGSKPYPLDGRRLGSGEYLLLPRGETGIALNNDQDIVRIIGPLPGGGSGVLQSQAYQGSKPGQAFAFRSDARWLWTPYGTPGSDNRFEEVDMQPFAPLVELSAALPNPAGDDRYGEWIELENMTMRPQWLNGWQVRTESGKVLDLKGLVIPRKERLRLDLERRGFTLRNGQEALMLMDPSGQIRSVLSWKGAQQEKIIRKEKLESAGYIKDVTVIDPQRLRGRYVMNDEFEEGPRTTAVLAGLSTPSEDSTKNNSINLISALTEGKNIELLNDTEGTLQYAHIDGADVTPILLRAGLAYVPAGLSFTRRLEYEAYERDARRHFRGLWADADLAAITDQKKLDEELDSRAVKEGIHMKVSPSSGVVESGALITVASSLPANFYYRVGTGAAQSFSGSLHIQEGIYSFFAEYHYKTASGETLRSTVATHEYAVKKQRYDRCLKVSEVYPSPQKGENEWAEIINQCDWDLSLLGWSVDDVHEAGSKPMTFGTGIVINALGVKILSGSTLKISLNNGGDAVTLHDPAGRVSDSVWYTTIKKGRSYALQGDRWCVTDTVTPLMDNVCYTQPSASKKKKSAVSVFKVGLGTKYMSVSGSEFLANMNIKREQDFMLYKGLNGNSYSLIVWIYVYLVTLLLTACLLSVWMWQKQRLKSDK